MRVYVLRHAIAESAAPGQRDDTRELTRTGRKRCKRVLRHARGAGVGPAVILTSPYARALQTAEIACQRLGVADPPIVTESLAPYASLHAVWDSVRDHAAVGDVLISGHNPQLSMFVAWMLGARADALWLKKSALAALEVRVAGPQPRAALAWLLTHGSLKR